jgi:hypothetical protein
MTFCPNCGTQSNNVISKFCASCGSARNVTEPIQSTPTQGPLRNVTPRPTAAVPPTAVVSSDPWFARIHWGVVLLIAACTLGLAIPVIVYFQFAYLKKLDPAFAENLKICGVSVSGVIYGGIAGFVLTMLFIIPALVIIHTMPFALSPLIEEAYRRKGIEVRLNPIYLLFGMIYYLQYHLGELVKLQDVPAAVSPLSQVA